MANMLLSSYRVTVDWMYKQCISQSPCLKGQSPFFFHTSVFSFLFYCTCIFFFALGLFLPQSADWFGEIALSSIYEPWWEEETCWKSLKISEGDCQCAENDVVTSTTCAVSREQGGSGGWCPFVDSFNLLVIPSWVGQQVLLSDGSSQ